MAFPHAAPEEPLDLRPFGEALAQHHYRWEAPV